MELRSQARIAAVLVLAVGVMAAQTATVRHDHLWKRGAGTLTVSREGIVFEETSDKDHSRAFNWENIQQLELGDGRLRILTYEDRRWQAGRDRDYSFAGVPASFATAIHPLLEEKLGAKYVAALALPGVAPVWRVGAKLRARLGGSEGELAFAGDSLIYRSHEQGESRTWPVAQIESVSTSQPYELTVAALERAGWTRGPREFRFQLKSPLSEAQYQALWRAVNRAKGLALFESSSQSHTSDKENQQ